MNAGQVIVRSYRRRNGTIVKGCVRTNPNPIPWEQIQFQPRGCWLWSGASIKGGYGRITWQGKPINTHRLMWQQFYGPIPQGLDVLHHCDVPACIRPDHLFLGDDRSNVLDAIKKGRFKLSPRRHGEDVPNSKLSASAVREIRERYRRGEQQRVLAAWFHVSAITVSDIVRGITWKHLL